MVYKRLIVMSFVPLPTLRHLYFCRMGRRRKPIICGLKMAVGYQKYVYNLLIAMGFVPLPILRLLRSTNDVQAYGCAPAPPNEGEDQSFSAHEK